MTFKTTKLRDAITFALVTGATALAGTGVAYAQEADTGATTTNLDRIEVTGSRIRKAEIENEQPVISVTRAQIQQQGFTSVADILQNLTSAGSPAISRSQSLSSGEDVGGYFIDIRNLGSQRTLVLVNGKRLGVSTSGSQDLSQIPLSAIERIDILKDGGSSLYGSDAIAGVVNVITRRNFDGAEANAYIGQFSEGDGQKEAYDLTIGSSGERTSMTLSFEYSKDDPVFGANRDFSSYGNVGASNADKYPFSGFSPVSGLGSALLPCGPGGRVVYCTLTPGADSRVLGNYSPITPAQFADPNAVSTVQTGIERRSVFASGTVDISDNLRFTTDLSYNKRETLQQAGGYPYQSAAFGTPISGDSFFSPTPGTDVEFRRRLAEVPRRTRSDLETFRIAPTIEGSFELSSGIWDWDIGANLNRNNVTKFARGDSSLLASERALGGSYFNAATGRVECGSAANPISYGTNFGNGECVPWNPLVGIGDVQAGGLTGNADLQAFLFPQYSDTGRTESKTYSANLTGPLFKLPAGDLSLAVGVEHRIETGEFVPDAFAQAGLNSGLPATTTAGGYSLDEVYVELDIPVLSDVPFAKELAFNVASRYSDYSNFGNTLNSKFGLRWRPIDGLLVRGTYAEGFRAPSINDSFGGIGGSFEFYTDPCGTGAPNSVNGNAACSGAGVPVGYQQLGQGLEPCTALPCQTPDQFLSGSNPNLSPETATTKTLGLVYSPQFVTGLDISLDWFNYQLDSAIISDSVDRILRDCYVLNNATRCAGIVRAPDGHITNLFYGLANLGSLETEGYDLSVAYRLPEMAAGQFAVKFDNSYTTKYDEVAQNANGDAITVGSVGTAGIFRVRSNLGLSWEKGDFGASYGARYYSGINESCVPNRPCSDPDRIANGEPDPLAKRGSNTFHDIQVYTKLPWNATASIGANNFTNHLGPILFTQPNSNFPYYGGFEIGRTIYMKYQQRF